MRQLPVLLLLSLLAACAGAPKQPSYYLLRSPVAEGSGELQISKRFAMGHFELAPYLEQPGIVMETGSGEVRPANHNRWAEPPREALARYLGDEVSRALGEDVTHASGGNELTLFDVRIDQLHGTEAGEARLVASWSVRDAGAPARHYRFSESTTLNRSGYPALVQSMQALLSSLSRSIAGSLTVPG